MNHHLTIGLRSLLSLGFVLWVGACDNELSDQELIERSRHAQEHQSSSETSPSSESNASEAEKEQARARREERSTASEKDEASADTGLASSSKTASADTSSRQAESIGPEGDVSSQPEGLYDHPGFCTYTVRQALGAGSNLISSLSGRLQLDDRGRVETVKTSTAFPNTEPEVMNRYEVVSYGDALVELVNYMSPESAGRTRIEVSSDHNLATLRQDTSGDGSYDKQSLFVYGGAPTDVLVSGTAYMLSKNRDSMRDAFEMTYDDQGRVVSARQVRGDKSGRTFEFSYANGYFERAVETDANGTQTGFWKVEFDDRGRPTKIKKRLGVVDEFNAIESFDYKCD